MNEPTEKQVRVQSWISLVLLSIVWGSSFILIKIGLEVYNPFEVATIRILCSSLAFLPIIIWLHKEINWSNWKYFLAVGLMGSGIPAFLYPLAQQQISSAIAGVLNSLTPAFAFLVGIILFKQKFNNWQFVGLSIGLIGAIALAAYGEGSFEVHNILYAGFAILACLCYSLNVNMIKAFFEDTRSIIISAMSFGMIGPPALIYLLYSDVGIKFSTHIDGYTSFLAIIVLSLFGTVAATILFFRLVKMTSPVFAASVCYLMPIVSIAWGYWDGEYVGIFHLIVSGIILGGVYLIERGK